MKVLHAKPAKAQRGSIYTTMVLVALFGLFILAGLKIVPAYIDNNVIVNAMNGMAANNGLAEMNIADIRSTLMRTLNTNRVEGFDAANVVLVKEGGKEYIDVNYEARKPLFYNIEAVVIFKNRFEKK